MEHLAAGLLLRSPDPIAIIRLSDEMVVDVNEAYFAMTGFSREEVVGHPTRELAICLEPSSHSVISNALRTSGSIGNVQAAFFTRSGELRVGELSALVVDAGGQQDAVCAIRNSRDPTPGERRRAAREELHRTVRGKGSWPAAAAAALRALGQCLRWDLTALWSLDDSDRLRCMALWRASLVEFPAIGQARQRTALPPPTGLPLRVLEVGRATWIPDVVEHPGLPSFPPLPRSVHGWLGFPAVAGDRIVGVVELYSREVRQPDDELLSMTGEFGQLFGRLVQQHMGTPTIAARPEADRPTGERQLTGPAHPEALEAPAGRDRLRDLAAAAGANGASATQSGHLGQVDSPELLQELATRVGKLNSLLEDVVRSDPETRAPTQPATRVLAGLTLKAVSARTGIPAATLRTWERRYSLTRPVRSDSGYRLYGEDDIARILQVKSLLRQGVRVSAAVAAVMDAVEGPASEATRMDTDG